MYTLGTENYSFDDITTDLTQCPAYPAMTCIKLHCFPRTFPFQNADGHTDTHAHAHTHPAQ